MTPDTVTTLAAAGGFFVGICALALSIYASLRSDMRQIRVEMAETRRDLTGKIEATAERLEGNIRETEERLKSDIRETEERLKSDIRANAERIEAVEGRLGELGERVARVDGKLDFLYRFVTRQNEPPPAPAE